MSSDDDFTLQHLARATLGRGSGADAMEFEGRWYDWATLRAIADSVNDAVKASGVGKGQPIALIPRNRPEAVAALIALIASGQTIQMLYAFQKPAAIARSIATLGPAVVIAGKHEIGPQLIAIAKEKSIALLQLDEDGARVVDGLGRTGATGRTANADNPVISVHTSGTTGAPKQMPFPYEMFFRSHILAGMGLGDKAQLSDIIAGYAKWSAEPPMLLTFPLGNITGLYSTLPTLLRGQRAILADRFSIEAWHDWVVRFRPKHGGLPPAGLQMILDKDYPVEDLTSIQMIGTGAAPLDPAVQRAFEDKYGIPILLSYGATEFGGPVTAMRPEHIKRFGRTKLGSVGPAMPGARLRIIDADNGAELPANEQGIVEVVSPRIGPDWIRTSDLGMIDADGFLFLYGRADSAIMRGGFKLVPDVIEKALYEHPAISDVAVDRRKDQRLGELPVAVVQLKQGAKWPGSAALEAHVRERLPATHVPVDWIGVDALPRNRSMKLDRPALRQLIEQAGAKSTTE